MEIEILNQDFELLAIVDGYESFIWTDRYNTPGDFELFAPVTDSNLTYFARDNYVRIDTSDRLMIIEDIVYQSSPLDSGNHIKITGRSLESILDRRIIWGELNVDGNLQDEVEKIFNQCIINPSDNDRKISNFIFEKSSDEKITSLTVSNQYKGDSVLDIIQTLTNTYDIGWKVILNDDKKFIFSFYTGTDRSYAQDVNPHVVFSPQYENVIESEYMVSGSSYKNVALVEGSSLNSNDYNKDDETLSINTIEPIYRTVGSGTGLLRREMYDNETGIQQEEGMSEEEFNKKLDQAGTDALKEFSITKKFDGQYETKIAFVYGKDFFIGDTVEVADEFGNEASSKVIEFIWSNNVSNGEEAYPTFRSDETNIE